MTTAAGQYPVIGLQPIGNFSNAVEVSTGSGYVPLIPVGTIISYNDPYWGAGEAIRLQIAASTTVNVGNISTISSLTAFNYTPVPNTANLGQPVGFAMNAVASNTNVQYAWFSIAGRGPVYCGATVAANTAFGITAAGQGGAIAAGKQIVNARVQTAATATVAKAATLTGGKTTITVANTDGWFVGLPIAGTGIPASTTISAIDTDNKTVTMSAAATAGGSATVTATYNDATNFWNVAVYQRPFAQGQIL